MTDSMPTMDLCFYAEDDCKNYDYGPNLQAQLIEERKISKRLGDALIHCTKENIKVTQQLMVERHHLNLVVMEIRKLRLEVLDWRTIVDILVAEIKVVAPFVPIAEDEDSVSMVWSPMEEDVLSDCEVKLEVKPEISIALPNDDSSTAVNNEVGKHWLDTDDVTDTNEITYSDVEAMLADDAESEPVKKKPVSKRHRTRTPVPKKNEIKIPGPKKDIKKKTVPKKKKKKKKTVQTKKKKDKSKKVHEKTPGEITEENFVKGINGYQCKICKKVISARAYLAVHLARHKRTKFQCELCAREFRDKPKLRDHVMFIHFKVPRERSTCEICGKTFQTKQNVKRHKNTAHRSERPFLCDLCGKGFKVKTVLKQHMQFHEKKEDRIYTCRHCGLELNDLIAMNQHRKTHPVNLARQCDVCGLVLPTPPLLWEHWKTHPDIQRFPCDLCDKVFPTKTRLQCHKKSSAHSFKPMACNVCDKRFSHRSSLRTHKQTFHKKCETCGKEFKLASMLEEHSYVHTGIPPFQCPVCSAQFIDRKVFWKHKLTHDEFRPHVCDICGNRFNKIHDMRNHRNLHQKWGDYIPPGGRYPRKDGQPSKKRRKPAAKREPSYFEELIWRR